MFDIDEIRKQALASMRETMEKNEERISKIEVPSSEKGASVSAAEVEEQIAANIIVGWLPYKRKGANYG